jgi:hypothetical protein
MALCQYSRNLGVVKAFSKAIADLLALTFPDRSLRKFPSRRGTAESLSITCATMKDQPRLPLLYLRPRPGARCSPCELGERRHPFAHFNVKTVAALETAQR